MITITIKTDNAAFDGNRAYEVAAILKRVAQGILDGQPPSKVWDSNGNTVGTVVLTGKDRTR